METRNAIITRVSLEHDDHGILVGWVYLDYGGAQQGFGGYELYRPIGFNGFERQVNSAGHFIWRVMEVVGVFRWEELAGKCVRVKARNEGIEAIGHIVKDDWFEPRKEFETMIERKAVAK